MPAQPEPVLFEADLPHPQLGSAGMRWCAAAYWGESAVTGGLVALGAWPVIGFTGPERCWAAPGPPQGAGARAAEMLLLSESG